MEVVKLETEVAQYRERLDTVRAMNVNLQKINGKYKRKAQMFDFINLKCEELHKANQRLIQILSNINQMPITFEKEDKSEGPALGFEMPLEELRMYQDIIQKYNMGDNVNSMIKQ